MRDKAVQNVQVLRSSLPCDKARMLALSRTAIEQVRTQRDHVKAALERTMKEVHQRQDDIHGLEFSKPSSDDLSKLVTRLEQAEEAAKWQQHEIEALTVVEQRISR